MELSKLPKITTKKAKRLGQGHGSGRGKTSGRGTKGQKARRDIPLHFEGGALSIIKRLPKLRGKGKNNSLKPNQSVLNVRYLNLIPANSTVDIQMLIKHKLVDKDVEKNGVKILGEGDLSVPLTVKLPVSKGARAKIEKAGGTVEA